MPTACLLMYFKRFSDNPVESKQQLRLLEIVGRYKAIIVKGDQDERQRMKMHLPAPDTSTTKYCSSSSSIYIYLRNSH